jgi:hypothetical protein
MLVIVHRLRCCDVSGLTLLPSSGEWLLFLLTLFSEPSVTTVRIGPGPLSLTMQRKRVSIITTNHLKTGAEPTPETSCISNIPQTISNVQHSVYIMIRPLSQTFRALLSLYVMIKLKNTCSQFPEDLL